MKKKRLGAVVLAMAMLLYGCGAGADKGEGAYRPESGGGDKKVGSAVKGSSGDGIMDAGGEGGEMSNGAYGEMSGAMDEAADVMGVAPKESAMADSFALATSPVSADASDGEGGMEEPAEEDWSAEAEVIDPEPEPIEPIEPIEPMPGLLTAGEWCDNQNWGFMANLVSTGRFDFHVYGMKPYERVVLHVLSGGEAAPNVKAELMDAEGNRIAEAVTDYAGNAYLYYNVYADEMSEPAYVMLNVNNTLVRAELFSDAEQTDTELEYPATGTEGAGDGEGQEAYPQDGQGAAEDQEPDPQNGQWQQAPVHLKSSELTVEIMDYVRPAKRLDLMFVFDTTGSMGDELLYLQKEFEDIAGQVADQSTRFSVNFYRDFEDEYVVRSNEFISDINKVVEQLNAEYADGGGDYEEAVDLALVNAVLEHDWNTDSVKLLFLILDAPPHNTAEVAANLKEAVSAASSKGIRIIPIASSGVDTATEALLRDMAMLTGGTYTFLTNDSGIGLEHLEPTIGSYTVEALNNLIVRLIRQYYQ